jgi:hypothetical protein
MEELQSITNNSNKIMKGLTVDTEDDKIAEAVGTPTSAANDSQL